MKLVRIFLCTVLALVVLDMAVGAALSFAQAQGRFGSLVRYFDYGRSVPGKLAQWEAEPDSPGNLYALAWPETQLVQDTRDGPVVRAYGMSFVNRILRAAEQEKPGLAIDLHAGPGAPPNFTFSLFEADRPNRQSGDVVVLGILSSSLTGMGSLSNRSWNFEQPAPATYPIYLPDGAAPGLRRIDPLVQSLEDQKRLSDTPSLRAEWQAQQRAEDHNWDPAAFLLPELDVSPFVRLLRRSLAISGQEARKAGMADTDFPVAEVLQRMVVQFAQTARSDGQVPVVFLIQSRDPRDPDLQGMLAPVLATHEIATLATAERVSPLDAIQFLPDGHFRPEVDQRLAQDFLKMVASSLPE